MSSTPTSKHTTSRGFIYNYIHITPTSPNKEYILFLHGFPSIAHDYHHQVAHFSDKGYGIIVPDLLGYGESSKPLDLKAYSGKGMAQDLSEILAKEGIEKVIGVGHDWYVSPTFPAVSSHWAN
jgi:soluble epoxide hydrolase/lipid-phosphate phosphatase